MNYKKRLQFIRKLDIITDVYHNPEEIFTKSTELLKKYLPFFSAVLRINKIDNKTTKYYTDDNGHKLEREISEKYFNEKKSNFILNGHYVYIRPLVLKKETLEHENKMFGYFIFFYKNKLEYREKLLLRDYIDFINDSLFMIGKIDKIKSLFSKYIPESIVQKMDSIKDINSLLKGKKSDVAIFFADIRGFTCYSEKHTPEEVIKFLNSIFSVIVKEIFLHDGMVDKFIGDAVMAVFGAPISYSRPYVNAINAAISIQTKINKLKNKYPEIGIGIGINFGPAISGNIGTIDRLEYTAIGDTVNVASRLESISKAQEILINSNLNDKVKDIFKTKFIGTHLLKGKADAQKVYKILGSGLRNSN
ncbi:MAG: adenylate/guanylate cyclase domain-containing protein [Candidatus Muirbacterium halophilum]|nr:adenylate/guanylate cyclase domain-containing protein [Candidatus Muirbacterium halophilum]MCK9475175.1 adenylate/guanylate cyclase domain-containing protein [Candidatus Muirbacterium halophilum]